MKEVVQRPNRPEDDFSIVSGELYGEGLDADTTNLLAATLNPNHSVIPTLIEQITNATPRWNKEDIPKELDSILRQLNFHARGNHLIPQFASIPFFKRVGERIDLYKDKHTRTRDKGKPEAAEYGAGKLGDQDVVVFAMHYDFMGGSVGAVAGEKLIQATELAHATKRPLLTIYSSGGARQDENVRALYQMERTVAALEKLKIKTPHVPNVAILLGEVWGGVTASAMPRADLRIAYTGTRMGFAGPSVIANHEQQEVPENAQRVEVHALQRNVDVLVQGTPELIDFLTRFLAVQPHKAPKFDANLIPPTNVVGPGGNERFFKLSKNVVAPSFYENDLRNASVLASAQLRTEPELSEQIKTGLAAGKTPQEASEAALGTILNERYRNLLFDAARPDTEMILKQVFQDVVPLYNHFYDKERGEYVYPAIIAAIGRIGLQPFLVAGDQPSYRVEDNEVKKILSTPKPSDLKYLLRMLTLGNKLGLPLVLLTDTPGAEPSLASELQGQFEDIASILARYPSYEQPVMSIITGLQGSGGGLVTSPRGDSLAMFSKALMTVAEPGAASTIVYGPNATPQNRTDTLLALGPTSEDQHKIDLVDSVIMESDNPYETIASLREHIIATYGRLALKKTAELIEERYDRLRRAKVFKVSEAKLE